MINIIIYIFENYEYGNVDSPNKWIKLVNNSANFYVNFYVNLCLVFATIVNQIHKEFNKNCNISCYSWPLKYVTMIDLFIQVHIFIITKNISKHISRHDYKFTFHNNKYNLIITKFQLNWTLRLRKFSVFYRPLQTTDTSCYFEGWLEGNKSVLSL